MDERKEPRVSESTVEQPVQSDGRTMLEQAFARGSSLNEVPAVAHERTEHSVMEGLPPAKAERIAAMRRELAELQRQLIEAQQRIATELQGRADDAERFEAIEARLQAQEAKAQEDATRAAELTTEIASLRAQLTSATASAEELRRDIASRDAQVEDARRGVKEQLDAQSASLNEAKALLAARDGELATRTTERDNEQATRARLERELEEQRKQHAEATTQLESQLASLRDTNALLATRDAELAALASERDALKAEAAAAHTKVRDVANQLARFGQELLEGAGAAQLVSTAEPSPAVTTRSADRPKPPPVPAPRAAAEPPPVETILEVTEAKSKSRIGMVLLGGALGCIATFTAVKLTASSSTIDDARRDVGETPTAALVSERPTEPASPAITRDETLPAAGTPPAPPAPSSQAGAADRASQPSDSPAAAPAEIETDGVLVLPKEADDHRLFVDGRVVPVKNLRAVVSCGTREIKIGSRGTPQTVEVACGGETVVPPDARDRKNVD